ncbi:MAG: hypothetical protein JRH19_10635 [Deltaproteobacteria bacterium]|nr:hypothetical protein [Deltaproteobacteria bacterium]
MREYTSQMMESRLRTRGLKTELSLGMLLGILAMVAAPLAANADVTISVSPDVPSATPSDTVTLDLYYSLDDGQQADIGTWSVGCDEGCELVSFLFNEAYSPGSGFVRFSADPGGVKQLFALGGGDNLNTSGSGGGAGDGLGLVDPIEPGNSVGTIGHFTLRSFATGDGNAYLIGTLTVRMAASSAQVTPFFVPGLEGVLNGDNLVPSTFGTATLPEPATVLLGATCLTTLAGLAMIRRRARS